MRATIEWAVAELTRLKDTEGLKVLDTVVTRLHQALQGRPSPGPAPRVPAGCYLTGEPWHEGQVTVCSRVHPEAVSRELPPDARFFVLLTEGGRVVAHADHPRPLLRLARQRGADVRCLFDLSLLETS